MKKLSLSIILCLTIMFSLVACGNKNGSVTLGDYSKIEVAKADVEVTEEDIDSYITSLLEDSAVTSTVTEGTVESGDTVNISYTGYVDGQTFDGGSAENSPLTIGSGSFIDGFEDGLIGAAIGSTVELNLTFPDPYEANTDLSGKAVLFQVTINSKDVKVTPELTDAWVTENYASENLTTIDAFREYARNYLEEDAMQTAIWTALFDGVTVDSYNEEELESSCAEEKANYEESISSSYGMELADYLSLTGTTEEDFDKNIKDSVKDYLKQKMTIEAIADKEKLTVSDDELNDALQEYTDYYGYESIDALKEALPENATDKLKLSLLAEKVMDILSKNAVVVDKVEETTTATDTTAATE